MKYLLYRFSCKPLKPTVDILVSFLAEVGFESFVETESGLDAYLPADLEEPEAIREIVRHIDAEIAFSRESLPDENWNALWESDYEPVVVDKKFRIRAPFHDEDRSFEYDILISPQMSFGTGHHQTTRLMLKALSAVEVAGKEVVDAGSGTGVLAIAANMMGASRVLAYDIEERAFENTNQNIALNNAEVEVRKGNVDVIKENRFDIVLANINKNVLVGDMRAFHNALNSGGYMILSGFFVTDRDEIRSEAEKFGSKLVSECDEDSWACMMFQMASYE